jgi:glutamate synthase domain-containing protein 1
MLVLQSCTDFRQVMADSSTEAFPTPSDGTYDVGNVKFEECIDMKEEVEVNVKTENVMVSEDVKCIDIRAEDCMYSEEEKGEEVVINKHEEEDVEIKEEVS